MVIHSYQEKNVLLKNQNFRREEKIKKGKIKINITKNIIKGRNKIIINYIIINLIKLIIIDIFSQIKSYLLSDTFYFQHLSKVTLKIKGKEENAILGKNEGPNSCNIVDELKDVYINGDKQDIKTYKYYFNQTDNLVELIFNDNINSCKYMFLGCSNITEIDLSNFKTLHVTNMNNMFSDCLSLTSINLTNIDTSNVVNMVSMFNGCKSLTSLDLFNFNTEKVTNMIGCLHIVSH